MKINYVHIDIPEISTDFLKEGDVLVKNFQEKPLNDVMAISLLTVKIANFIGIALPKFVANKRELIPYSDSTDNLIFESPISSFLLNKHINFMRGWKQFESCIKGFNGLGLMAEQMHTELQRIDSLSTGHLNELKIKFLASRLNDSNAKIFTDEEIRGVNPNELIKVHKFDVALWNAFGAKTIVCSTSSNMGISLHDALRYFQKTQLHFNNKTFTLLNKNEGKLIIWCPDENADFMNKEKTAFLKSLEEEKPPLTKLRTYINRTQRDPGALKDALLCGGYFFPTNPQSRDEVQNLLFFSLSQVAEERNQTIAEILKDESVKETLRCTHCIIENGKVYVEDRKSTRLNSSH